jgi:hypothetical protein
MAEMAFDVVLETDVLMSPSFLTEHETHKSSSINNPGSIEAIHRQGVWLCATHRLRRWIRRGGRWRVRSFS